MQNHLKDQTRTNPDMDEVLIKDALEDYRRDYDKIYGGFGQASKFPTPHNLLFLMWHYERSGDKTAMEMADLENSDLEYAVSFFDKAVSEFYDKEHGGFFLYGEGNEPLILRPKETYDGAILISDKVFFLYNSFF